LENYAYARQGAARAYPIIAKQAIDRVFAGTLEIATIHQAEKVWRTYQEIAKKHFNQLKTNPGHNPLNSSGGVLVALAKGQIGNLAKHIKTLIKEEKTGEAHALISSIRGVGPKIASLYLRDIAHLSELDENQIKDQFYLQPMDTWLDQTLSIIAGNEVHDKLENKQRTIVELCHRAGCSPIAFNQGAWVLGSRIAGDFSTFRKLALGKEDAHSIIEDRIIKTRKYLQELEKVVGFF
jgi:hypothetical protein